MKKVSEISNQKRLIFSIFCCILAIFIILRAPERVEAEEVIEFNRDLRNYNSKLQILGSDQEQVAEFSIAIANDDYKKMYGLMHLDYLPSEYGMLFPFPKSQVIAMWMKNTLIPLDMIFINDNNTIVAIKTNAKPKSLDIISSEEEARKVLEINAGLVKKLGIKTGQKIILK